MAQGRNARILIVDDEPELRELLFDAFNDGEMIVSVAASGSEAIQLAKAQRPDIVITDLCLGDCSGLDVIDNLRDNVGDVPAVVITGHSDAESLTEASRHRPIELMTKPLNLDRLRTTIAQELHRLAQGNEAKTRVSEDLRGTCLDMTRSYRTLSDQVLHHRLMIQFQQGLLASKTDDDVFRAFFRTFVRRAGAVSGAALVCDSSAELRVIGRFGVPQPDSLEFCKRLADPMIDILLADPHVQLVDGGEEVELFDESIRRFVPGMNLLVIPLIPAPGEMIGVVILYRKGEQPFNTEEIDLAKMMSYPTAIAVRRND
ncbi:MAG: response regulator [Phycisphaerae bacterium]|nr:response regulator [Phycisphaerae bacterium]